MYENELNTDANEYRKNTLFYRKENIKNNDK